MERPSAAEGGDSQLRIQLLGKFTVWVGGERIADERWHLRRARSLVKLLALAHGHRLHRDQVADTLWPDSDLAASANNFHQTLYAARKALYRAGSDCLRMEEGFLSLIGRDGQAPWVDVVQFEAAARAARKNQDPENYRAALDLYQGDMLPDDLYEDWTLQRREYLRQLHLGLQQELAQLLETRGDYPQAIEVLTRLLSVDRVNEEAHVQLMRVYALSGKRGQALRQYQTLREVMRAELDVEPGIAAQQRYEDIQANRFPSPDVSVPPVSLSYLTPAASYQNNLPTQLTSFIGREGEITQVCQKVTQHRLVTLNGAGGVGKTRLALKAAEKLTEQFPHGVWLVELAPISNSTQVARAVAEIMKIPERAGKELNQTLVEYFQPRNLLLVLDNCEHVIAGVASLISQLLQGCPQIRILATSREILSVEGEMPFRCPSLSLPTKQDRQTLTEVSKSDAVRLFIERACSAWPEFTLTEANVPLIAQICQRLDGIPLAIELASARTRMLSLDQIASRLDHAFNLLTGSSRSALPRHQTLRALIDWSYRLLTLQEYTLLRRLSVFAGGWTLEAAEEVCADAESRSGMLKKEQILDLLGGLIDKSLVQFEPIQDEPRYHMLETVRQYCHERLLEAGEDEWIAERHLDYFLALSLQAEPHLRAWGMVAWLDRLDREVDNLRLAMATSLAGAVVKGLQLASNLMWFWHIRGHRVEGVEWLERLLHTQETQRGDRTLVRDDQVTLGRALTAESILIWNISGRDRKQGKKMFRESHAIFQQLREDYPLDYAIACFYTAAAEARTNDEFSKCHDRFQALNDPFWTAETDRGLAKLHFSIDMKAFVYLEEGLALYKQIGDLDGEAGISNMLVYMELCYGKADRFLELNRRALACFNAVGNREFVAGVLEEITFFYLIKGKNEEALRESERVLSLAQERNDQGILSVYLTCRACVAWATKDYDLCIRYCEQVLEIGSKYNPMEIDFARFFLCRAYLSLGELIQAKSHLKDFLNQNTSWSYWGLGYRAIQTLGLIAAREGQMEKAATWFGAQREGQIQQATTWFGVQDVQYGCYGWLVENLSLPERSEYEKALATVHAALGDEAFNAALEAGRAMTIEQILQSALEATGEKLNFRAEPEGSTRTTAE